MGISDFWMNPFGQNVAQAGVSGPGGTPYWDKPVGIMGEQPAIGGGLLGAGPTDASVKRDTLMATAAALLAGSGYSPQRRSSSEILGSALMAGQQARAQAQDRILKQRYMEAQMQEMQKQAAQRSPFGAIDPDQFTPESLAEFQRSGDYGVLKPRGGLSGVGNFNPGDYTPESFAKFLKSQNPADLVRYVAPAQPSVQVVNGVPTVVQPTRGGGPTQQDPLSSLPSEAAAAAALAAAKAEGTTTGTGVAEIDLGKAKKKVAALNVLQTIDLADPLIDAATGSATGAAADKVAAFFGKTLSGAEAIASLKVLQANLMTNMPRMEGPQSDRDVQLYREAAGQIGEPTVPPGMKKAALNMIRALQQKYADDSIRSPSGYSLVPEDSPEAAAGKASNIQQLLDKYSKPQ